jgi:hypothetical protein
MLETQLYAPVKTFLQKLGYKVAGEVHSCDVVARKDKDVLIVELKKEFNLDLVLQGIQRQALSKTVYLAIESPRKKGHRRRWRRFLKLCRMLGLGLMTVRFRRKLADVEVVLDPAPYISRINARKRSGLLKEFESRATDCNVGGCTRRKIVTAYREQVLRIACALQNNGPSKVKALVEASGSRKTASILQKNYYEWFERVGRGIYSLTPAGIKGLETYAAAVAQLRNASLPNPVTAAGE